MPIRPRFHLLLALAVLVVVALAESCSKKSSTAPNQMVTGPTFNFTFPQTGTSHEFMFPDAGSWDYRCIPHSPGMSGTVIVDAGSANDSVLAGPVQVGENGLDAREVDRLREIVGGASPQRLHRGLDTRLPRDEDDLRRSVALELLQQVHARAVRQVQVDQDRFGQALSQLLTGIGQARCRQRREPFPRHDFG